MTDKYNPLDTKIDKYGDMQHVPTRIESFERWFRDNYVENNRFLKIKRKIEPASIEDDPAFPYLLAISLKNIRKSVEPGVKNKSLELFNNYIEDRFPGLFSIAYTNIDQIEFELNMEGFYFRTYSIVENAFCSFQIIQSGTEKFELIHLNGNNIFYIEEYIKNSEGHIKKSTRKDSGFVGHEHIDLTIPILNFVHSHEVACKINEFFMNPAISPRHITESLSNPKILKQFTDHLSDTERIAALAVKISGQPCDLNSLVDLIRLTGTTELRDMVHMAKCLNKSDELKAEDVNVGVINELF